MRVKAVDAYDEKFNAPIVTTGPLATAKFVEVKQNFKQFVITGITTQPKKIPEVHHFKYTVGLFNTISNSLIFSR